MATAMRTADLRQPPYDTSQMGVAKGGPRPLRHRLHARQGVCRFRPCVRAERPRGPVPKRPLCLALSPQLRVAAQLGLGRPNCLAWRCRTQRQAKRPCSKRRCARRWMPVPCVLGPEPGPPIDLRLRRRRLRAGAALGRCECYHPGALELRQLARVQRRPPTRVLSVHPMRACCGR